MPDASWLQEGGIAGIFGIFTLLLVRLMLDFFSGRKEKKDGNGNGTATKAVTKVICPYDRDHSVVMAEIAQNLSALTKVSERAAEILASLVTTTEKLSTKMDFMVFKESKDAGKKG